MPGLFPDLLESPGINAGRHIGSAKKGGGYCTRDLATQEWSTAPFQLHENRLLSALISNLGGLFKITPRFVRTKGAFRQAI